MAAKVTAHGVDDGAWYSIRSWAGVASVALDDAVVVCDALMLAEIVRVTVAVWVGGPPGPAVSVEG